MRQPSRKAKAVCGFRTGSRSLERIEGIAEVIAIPGIVRLATASGSNSTPCLVKLSPDEARMLAQKLVEAAEEADR